MILFFRNTGNTLWSVASNWSQSDNGPANGHVPTSDDYVIFSSNSGNCTIDIPAQCLGISTVGVTKNYFYENAVIIPQANGVTTVFNLTLNTPPSYPNAVMVPTAVLVQMDDPTFTLFEFWTDDGSGVLIPSNGAINNGTVNYNTRQITIDTSPQIFPTGSTLNVAYDYYLTQPYTNTITISADLSLYGTINQLNSITDLGFEGLLYNTINLVNSFNFSNTPKLIIKSKKQFDADDYYTISNGAGTFIWPGELITENNTTLQINVPSSTFNSVTINGRFQLTGIISSSFFNFNNVDYSNSNGTISLVSGNNCLISGNGYFRNISISGTTVNDITFDPNCNFNFEYIRFVSARIIYIPATVNNILISTLSLGATNTINMPVETQIVQNLETGGTTTTFVNDLQILGNFSATQSTNITINTSTGAVIYLYGSFTIVGVIISNFTGTALWRFLGKGQFNVFVNNTATFIFSVPFIFEPSSKYHFTLKSSTSITPVLRLNNVNTKIFNSKYLTCDPNFTLGLGTIGMTVSGINLFPANNFSLILVGNYNLDSFFNGTADQPTMVVGNSTATITLSKPCNSHYCTLLNMNVLPANYLTATYNIANRGGNTGVTFNNNLSNGFPQYENRIVADMSNGAFGFSKGGLL
jgi:hypothetical protein